MSDVVALGTDHRAEPGALLTTAGLTVRFGGVTALSGVSLEIDEGRLTGLIGPNGAGKSTFVDAVSGIVPSTGSVRFRGAEIEKWSPHRRARAGIGRTFQGLELFEDLTVADNLLVSAEVTRGSAFVRDLAWPRSRSAATDEVARVLAIVGMEGRASALPSELSLGERRLVSVARALAGGAKLVFLDEPGGGLSSTEIRDLGDTLRGLVQAGLTVMLVDHDMGLVLGVSDVIHVLEFGKLIATGTPAQVRANEAVLNAYLGHGESAVPE